MDKELDALIFDQTTFSINPEIDSLLKKLYENFLFFWRQEYFQFLIDPSYRPLMQTCGRVSRNSEGAVIMYADSITKSMQQTITETNRRREIQISYNKKNNITPKTIQKKIHQTLVEKEEFLVKEKSINYGDGKKLYKKIQSLEKAMHQAAKKLDFEKATELRDELQKLRTIDLTF